MKIKDCFSIAILINRSHQDSWHRKKTTHCAGVNMDFKGMLYDCAYFQVKIIMIKWAMRERMGNTFSLEGSEKVLNKK